MSRAVTRAPKTSVLVARRILQDIVDKSLKQGDTLPTEASMMSEYAVGRASVREALRILEVHGLIVMKPGPGGGPLVNEVDATHFGHMATLYFQMAGATFDEIIETRIAIEPLMAGLIAKRADPVQLEKLRRCIETARSTPVDDEARYLAAATDFHGTIASISGNRVLDLFARACKELYGQRVVDAVHVPSTREQVLAEHDKIAAAILAGDARKAERLMRAHMVSLAEHVRQRHPALLHEIVHWS